MNQDKVFIILVNYNGWIDTIECLESLQKLDYRNFQIVIVDNGSSDSSVSYIQSWADGKLNVYLNSSNKLKGLVHPIEKKPIKLKVINSNQINSIVYGIPIIIIRSFENLGFAGGNNLGINLALNNGSDFLWLLNNDTIVCKDSLKNLIKKFKSLCTIHKKVGVIGSKLFYYYTPEYIQAVFGRYKPLFGNSKHIGDKELDKKQYDSFELENNDYIVGASMFLPKNYIEEVGLMTEDYFLYYEEIDWIKRGRLNKFHFSLCPNSVVFHKEGASIGSTNRLIENKSELSDYYSIKNKIKITKRFYRVYLPTVYFSYLFIVFNRIKRKQINRVKFITKIFIESLLRKDI